MSTQGNPRIEPIRAASDDESKRDVYRLLCMIHSMAGTMAVQKVGGWELGETNSSPMYGPIITVWNNGIVDVRAESTSDPERHVYSMYAARRDDDACEAQEALLKQRGIPT